MNIWSLEQAAQSESKEIRDLISTALENANDTVYIEKTVPESEFNAIALASLADALCFVEYGQATRDWFESAGVRW